MNDYLSKFIFGVRKIGGSDYRPTSLRGFLSSIQRYLNKRTTASQFLLTLCLKLQWQLSKKKKQKELIAKGLGNKPRTSDSLTDEEIVKLYASKCLGQVAFSSNCKSFFVLK